MKAKLLKLLKVLLSYIPTKLPISDSEFEAWAADILALTGFPDNDSMRFALCTMILHSKQGVYRVPKQVFAVQLKRAAANQAAGNAMQALKDKQDEQRRAEKAASEVVQETV